MCVDFFIRRPATCAESSRGGDVIHYAYRFVECCEQLYSKVLKVFACACSDTACLFSPGKYVLLHKNERSRGKDFHYVVVYPALLPLRWSHVEDVARGRRADLPAACQHTMTL